MSLIGKIQTLFSDREKTTPVFPRTKVAAVSDENGVGLDIILSEMDADIETKINAVTENTQNMLSNVNGLDIKKTNPITNTADDTVANWVALGSGVYWYSTNGQLIDQPSQYGFVLSIVCNNDVMQEWTRQSGGQKYYRSGNGSGWNGTWKRVIDETNFSLSGTTLTITTK